MLRRLRFFGHVIRSDPDEDHTRALNAGINDPPKEWKRPRGRRRQRWLRNVENDLKHQNLDCGRPGTELTTVICDVISWKRRRSCSSMLHDDDDDDDVVNRRVLFQKSSVSSMLRRPSKRDGQPSWSRIKNKNNKQE